MITIRGLARSYGTQTLFEDVSLQLDAGNRYGVVGANGAGKSTFLRILSGFESSSSGEIATPRNARVGVLSQDQFTHEAVPIQDVVMMGDDVVWEAMKAQEAMIARDEVDEERFAALEERIQRADGYALPSRASAILEGLGIPTRLHREPLRVLSGGFRLRVLLAQVLASRPDILLLDEPTNHLDIVSVVWLEKFMSSFPGCAVVVSHDQRFLDNACTHILDVDYQRIMLYKGNYSAFEVQKRETRERKEREIERRKEEIEEQKAWIARFKAKATKARQAASRAKQVERVVIEELPPSSRQKPTFRLGQVRPSGREPLTVKDLWKSYGDNLVLADASFVVQRGERVAVIGPNGAGKSTLLKILVGQLAADSGSSTWGYEASFGYFPQDHREILDNGDRTVLEWLWELKPGEGVGFVRGKLAEVLFSQDDVHKRLRSLSGGEAARLILAKLGIMQPNVLVLDEPTNHLDIESTEALAEALQRYPGTVLLVSHNRWLVERVATRVIEVSPGGLRDFPGTWLEYLAKLGTDHLDRGVAVATAKGKAVEPARPAPATPARPAPATPARAAPAPAPAPVAASAPAVPPPVAKKAEKAKAPPPKPKPKAKGQPLWFEDQPEDRPEPGSWAEFFQKAPPKGGARR